MSQDKNDEKTQAMLNRWVSMKRELALGGFARRPTNPLDIATIDECKAWRDHASFEIAKLVTDIQNAGLGEQKLRAMNDEINKLLREKSLWEDRIRQLGGPDFKKVVIRQVDSQGQEIAGTDGYLYFGAAKDLPGVREFLAREVPAPPSKSKDVLLKQIPPDYYATPEDPELLRLEEEAEAALITGDVRKRRKLEDTSDESLAAMKEGNQRYLESLQNKETIASGE